MKTNAERLFQMHFTKLVEIMKKMIENGNSVVKIWTDNISNLPFCFLADLEEDDVLDGIIFRGTIQPWSDEVEDLMPEEQKVRHTAGFIFKHKNIAHFIYLPVGKPIDEQECIEGTWDEIVSLMINSSISAFATFRRCLGTSRIYFLRIDLNGASLQLRFFILFFRL